MNRTADVQTSIETLPYMVSDMRLRHNALGGHCKFKLDPRAVTFACAACNLATTSGSNGTIFTPGETSTMRSLAIRGRTAGSEALSNNPSGMLTTVPLQDVTFERRPADLQAVDLEDAEE